MSDDPSARPLGRTYDAWRAAIAGPWLTDLGAAVLAISTAYGATQRLAIPWPLAIGVLIAVLFSRRPPLLWLAAAIAAASLAHTAQAGMVLPAHGPVVGDITLLSDPTPAQRGSGDLSSGIRVIARFDGKHVEVRAGGAAARPFLTALAGQRFEVVGDLTPLPDTARFLTRRHVVGRLSLTFADEVGTPQLPYRMANGLRRTIERGAGSLGATDRSLYTGLVFGDDRLQTEAVSDRFRASGLGHLLAVSGQNVAFVLLLLRPLLRRVTFGPRLMLTISVLTFFALVTRFEPSVCRATVMACGVAGAEAWGRPASGVRILSLTVTALLLADPFLVSSIGFLLSVAASAGIMIGARPLAGTIGGPRPVAEALAVPLAAQIAVGPVLIATFGGLPPASFPANVAVGPAAGWVMAYGMTIGLVAGLVPPAVATVLHVPTRMLLWWIDGIAVQAESLGWGSIGALGLAVACALALVLLLGGPLRGAARVGCVVVLLLALVLRPPESRATKLDVGVEIWRGATTGSVAIIDVERLGDHDGETGLDVDLLVLVGAPPRPEAIETLASAGWRPRSVLVAARWATEPGSFSLLGDPSIAVLEAEPGERVRVGDLVVHVRSGGPDLQVDVSAS